ncbi:uncharacterized protein GGS25DRAFT_185854 [Hypoxylon fragiforme]|uniref:uncharacterized protein n=1 Tax=Hypoxylon fragiforme TaxID=63214 RepID=UPI0020C665EB|nr:uncharacterized protein GGS25DRAFT_185854 [Hypoxylon fragiforme]KAI2611200.1 hypothetical protein GGS25DRAFT_185854 [Hypoxylon fragiforme]
MVNVGAAERPPLERGVGGTGPRVEFDTIVEACFNIGLGLSGPSNSSSACSSRGSSAAPSRTSTSSSAAFEDSNPALAPQALEVIAPMASTLLEATAQWPTEIDQFIVDSNVLDAGDSLHTSPVMEAFWDIWPEGDKGTAVPAIRCWGRYPITRA